MGAKKSFRQHIQRSATGDSDDVLYYPELGEVGENERHHVTLISWEDETTNWTATRLYARRGRHTYRLKDDSGVTKATVYDYDEEVVLTEGERLAVYFSGATSGDVLNLWVQGYAVKT